MKYRDNMTNEEIKKFMLEINELDALYASAYANDMASAALDAADEWEDEMDTLRRAALDHRGQP